MPMSQTFAAFAGGGGGLSAPSVADAFQNPGGIPDPRGATSLEGGGGAPPDILSMLRAGNLSPAELLEMIALLAGLGGAPPTGPAQQGSEVQQAFLEGAGGAGGGQPF